MLLAQRPEGRRLGDLSEETILGGAAGARPHQDVDAADLGVAVEQHRQRDLPEEPRDSGEQDLAITESLGQIDRLARIRRDGQPALRRPQLRHPIRHGSPLAAMPVLVAEPP